MSVRAAFRPARSHTHLPALAIVPAIAILISSGTACGSGPLIREFDAPALNRLLLELRPKRTPAVDSAAKSEPAAIEPADPRPPARKNIVFEKTLQAPSGKEAIFTVTRTVRPPTDRERERFDRWVADFNRQYAAHNSGLGTFTSDYYDWRELAFEFKSGGQTYSLASPRISTMFRGGTSLYGYGVLECRLVGERMVILEIDSKYVRLMVWDHVLDADKICVLLNQTLHQKQESHLGLDHRLEVALDGKQVRVVLVDGKRTYDEEFAIRP